MSSYNKNVVQKQLLYDTIVLLTIENILSGDIMSINKKEFNLEQVVKLCVVVNISLFLFVSNDWLCVIFYAVKKAESVCIYVVCVCNNYNLYGYCNNMSWV